MFSNSLNRILKRIVKQPEWDQYRAYLQVNQCWQQVVNKKAGENTRPLGIERGVLQVATSSAVWAQEMTLQRYSLIKKLNKRLEFNLKDIRFSPARWQKDQRRSLNQQNQSEFPLQEINLQKIIAEKQQAQEELAQERKELPTPDLQATMSSWLNTVKKSAQDLSACPNCQTLTPPDELARWQMCRYCIAQKWHSEYRPTQRDLETKPEQLD